MERLCRETGASCSPVRRAVLLLAALHPSSMASPWDEESGTEPTQTLTSLLSIEFPFKQSLLTFWCTPKAPELDVSVPQRWGWLGAEQGCRNPCSRCSCSSAIAESLFVPQQPDPLPCAVARASGWLLLRSLCCHNFNFVPRLKELQGLNECVTVAFLC